MHNRVFSLFPLALLLAGVSISSAQSPASLADFNGQVVRFQTLTNPLGGALVGALIRITPSQTEPATSGSALLSGQLFTTGDPTNAFYTPLDSSGALLQLRSANSSSFRATNEVYLRFVSGTNGFYTNVAIFSSTAMRQTNSIGVFTIIPGTNAAPAVDYVTGGGIFQPGNATSVSASGNGFTPKYQWQLNGTNVPNATNVALNISSVSPATVGNYTWVISNSLGAATSAPISISIAEPIVISQHPQSQTVMFGSYVTLSFAATGGIKSYSWMLNGNQAFGANTNPSYTLPQITSLRGGNYSVQISGYGYTTNGAPYTLSTSNALITVRDGGANATWLGRPFVKVADDRGMALPEVTGHSFTNWGNSALTPLITFRDGKLHFVAGTSAGVRSLFRWSNGVLSTLVFTNTPNPLGGFFGDVFYPTDEGNGVVNFTGSSVTNSGMFAWSASGISNIISANTIAPGRPYPFGGPGSYGRRNNGVAISAALFSTPGSFNLVGTGMYFHDGTGLARLCDDTTDLPGALNGYSARPTANSVNFDGTTVVFTTIKGGGPGGFFKSTLDGSITKLADHTDPLPGNPALTFTNFGDLDVDGGLIFGVADNGIYAFETNGTAMWIDNGVAVSAAGPRQAYYHTGNFIYRWKDGVSNPVFTGGMIDDRYVSTVLAVDGQGDDLAVLVRFTDLSHGIYVVRGVASTLPVITSEPLDSNVIENGNASFWVSAAGEGPLTYQWFKDSTLLDTRTNNSLLVSPVQASDVGDYSVLVSNPNGSVTSRVARLSRTVPATPTLLSGPVISPSTPAFGSNATITVTAAGQDISYTWYKNGAVLPGANTNLVTLSSLGASDRTNYFVVISNSASVLTSSVANLTIAPVITEQPVSVTNLVGSSASFSVSAIGIPPLTYQWRRGASTPTTLIAGATTTTLSFSSLSLADALNYRVTVTSGAGGSSTTSRIARLAVLNSIAPNSPPLSNPLLATGHFEFLLPTQTGYSYQVQSATNLQNATWTLEQTIPGDGSVKPVTVEASAPQKWIRVLVQ